MSSRGPSKDVLPYYFKGWHLVDWIVVQDGFCLVLVMRTTSVGPQRTDLAKPTEPEQSTTRGVVVRWSGSGQGRAQTGPVLRRMRLNSEQQGAQMAELPHTDPFLHLVSFQKASGCWTLSPALAAAMGKTHEEVNQDVWATVLALIWLHGLKADAKEEWELLAMKAVSWLRAQNAPCVKECVEAGNTVLGCSVTTDALGF